jgi:hypothetical protein
MKKIFTLFAFSIILQFAKAQNQNALDFDGIDDQVLVSNASSLITTGSGISLGLWVNPRNNAPNFPDFDGFGGFRNDNDADFYLVQIGPNTVEARFRNSSGINTDITFAGLLLNEWQHFVFTYDGNNIKLYHNGIEVGSQPASGAILNNTEALYIGNVVFSFNNFSLNGKIDDVVLYKKALSANEINCLMHGNVDSTDLALYYAFNQGTANGLNSGLNTLTGLTGQADGILSGFTLDGTSSNWVNGIGIVGVEIATFCNGTSYDFNGVTYTQAGTYTVYVPQTGACDSVISFTLNQLPVNVNITVANNVLSVDSGSSSYQWVDCDNNYTPILGATQWSLTAPLNGNYAVIVSEGNCIDTSACVNVIVTGVTALKNGSAISLWPVPANNFLTVKGLSGNENRINIVDEMGREVYTEILLGKQENMVIDITKLQNGIYFMITHAFDGSFVVDKFVVIN